MAIGLLKVTHMEEDIFNHPLGQFGNYFCNIKGIGNEQSYNDTLALFYQKLTTGPDPYLLFVEPIPDVLEDGSTDPSLPLTSSIALNNIFTEALNSVLSLVTQDKEALKLKLYKWSKLYIAPIDFGSVQVPKCLYYGNISRDEAYFLILLSLLGFDVMYFNPCYHTTLEEVDKSKLAQPIILGAKGLSLISFNERKAQGLAIEKVTTYAKKATNELEQTLYVDSGIYKPWQFSDGTTSPLIMDSVIEDTLTYWDEEARLRPGFRVNQKCVYTPVFFTKVLGVYSDATQYYQLVQTLKSAKDNCFFETLHLTSSNYGQTGTIRYHNVTPSTLTHGTTSFTQRDLSSLKPCLNEDLTINQNNLRSHPLYQKLFTLRSDTQNFILNKLDETLSPSRKALFSFPIGEEEALTLIAAVLTADERILNLIDKYDFTSYIPKIILYLNAHETCSPPDALLLGFLHIVGLDIIILSPSGTSNVELTLSSRFINFIKLDQFVSDFTLKAPSKKGFFNKLFK